MNEMKFDKGLMAGSSTLLVLSLLALAVSGAVLYLLLFGEKEPEYLTYREQQLLVLEGVDRNQYDPERFSVDSQGWLQYQSGGLRRGVCHDPGGLPGLLPGSPPDG